MPAGARLNATTTSSNATAAPDAVAFLELVAVTAGLSAMNPLPLYFWAQPIRPARACKVCASKALDQAGLNQQAIEPSRLGTIGATVEQAVAAFQDVLLFGKRWIERHPCSLLHQ